MLDNGNTDKENRRLVNKVVDYILDNESECDDFHAYPSDDHVFYYALCLEYGTNKAKEMLEEAKDYLND